MGSGCIIGAGASVFKDMTETMSVILDKQRAISDETQRPENALNHGQTGTTKMKLQTTCDSEIIYPDLCLPVAENYRISN